MSRIDIIKQEITSLQRTLQTMSRHNGDRSFVEWQLAELQTELKTLQKNTQTESDIQVVGNTVVETLLEPEPTFQPVVVDTQELTRVTHYLTHTAKFAKGSQKAVMYTNVKGQLKHQPLRQFIVKGLPYLLPGLDSILTIENYQHRLHALHCHEARVRLIVEGKVIAYEEMTPGMLIEKQREIQQHKILYQ